MNKTKWTSAKDPIYNQDDIEDEGPTLIDDDFMPEEEDQQEAWLHLTERGCTT